MTTNVLRGLVNCKDLPLTQPKGCRVGAFSSFPEGLTRETKWRGHLLKRAAFLSIAQWMEEMNVQCPNEAQFQGEEVMVNPGLDL